MAFKQGHLLLFSLYFTHTAMLVLSGLLWGWDFFGFLACGRSLWAVSGVSD